MIEVPFSIPLTGIVRIDGDQVVITVNRAVTSISLSGGPTGKAQGFPPDMSTYDIILEMAQKVVESKGVNRFTAPELYQAALDKYPWLKRNSFVSRVVASTPDHNSYKHYASRRDYFSKIGPGLYRLNDRYRDRSVELHPNNSLRSDADILLDQREKKNTP